MNRDSNTVVDGAVYGVTLVLRGSIALVGLLGLVCGIVFVFDLLKKKVKEAEDRLDARNGHAVTTPGEKSRPAVTTPGEKPRPAATPHHHTEHIHTLLFEVAMVDVRRTIQHTIEELTQRAQLDTAAGRHDYISELLLLLQRHKHAMSHARSQARHAMSGEQAEGYLNQVAHDTRSKFERDILRKTETHTQHTSKRNVTTHDELHDEDGDFDVHECVVLTLALAHTGAPIDPVPDASPLDTYMMHVREIAGLTTSQILRIEVCWSPSAESDAMSKADMMAHYPELIDII